MLSQMERQRPDELRRSLTDPLARDGHVSKEVDRIERRISLVESEGSRPNSEVREMPSLPLTPPPADSLPKISLPDEEPIAQSPPTPDRTPPRYPKGFLRKPSPTQSRQASSVAESFKTADEGLSEESSPEMERDVGLGLKGLKTSEGSETPTALSPKVNGVKAPSWTPLANIDDDPFTANESNAVRNIQRVEPDEPSPESTSRRRRKHRRLSMDEYAQQIEWPESDDESIHVDRKRLSELSNTSSQVVQAIVVSTPPQQRQKLRHSVKYPSLRAASSPLSGSNRSSLSDPRRTLQRKGKLSPSRVNRVSLNSDSGISMGSDRRKDLTPETPPRMGDLEAARRIRAASDTLPRARNETPPRARNETPPWREATRNETPPRREAVRNETPPRREALRNETPPRMERKSTDTPPRMRDIGRELSPPRRSRALPSKEYAVQRTPEQATLPKEKPRRKTRDERETRISDLDKLGTPQRIRSKIIDVETPQLGSETPQRQSSLKRTPRIENLSNPRAFSESGRKRRSVSDASPLALLTDFRGRRHEDPPSIPPRSSSLNAWGQSGSRSASLTSTIVRHKRQASQPLPAAHYQNYYADTPKSAWSPRTPRTAQTPQTLTPRTPRISIERSLTQEDAVPEEAVALQRRSLIATPFSAASTTPGPFELNEATAINIFPHSNTSVLVIQQFPNRRPGQRTSTSLSGNVRIELNGANGRIRAPAQIEHSPFKNPRPAPTPAVMLIPPTPGSMSPLPDRRNRRTTALTTVRRALSSRRYSEGYVPPLARALSGRRIRSERPAPPPPPPPKLSPFWRPRGFWNDITDSDSEPEEFVQNTVGIPQKRVIMGPKTLVRRLSKKRTQQPDPYADVEKRVGIIARLRNTSHLTPFASLQEAVRNLRAKRVEEKMERRRERLRQNIGPIVLRAEAKPFYNM